MSCYYTFYLMEKVKHPTDKDRCVYDYVGAFSTQDATKTGCAVPLEVRSRSFIHGDTFESWDTISYSDLSESAKKALFSQDFTEEEMKYERFHVYPFKEDVFEGKDDLLTRGYVTIDEFDVIVASDYDSEYLEWEADIKKPEFVAALPAESRVNYVPVAFLNRNSDTYIYETIRQAADMLNVYPFETRRQYYILCMIG